MFCVTYCNGCFLFFMGLSPLAKCVSQIQLQFIYNEVLELCKNSTMHPVPPTLGCFQTFSSSLLPRSESLRLITDSVCRRMFPAPLYGSPARSPRRVSLKQNDTAIITGKGECKKRTVVDEELRFDWKLGLFTSDLVIFVRFSIYTYDMSSSTKTIVTRML